MDLSSLELRDNDEPPIIPPHVDTKTQTVMSGSGFLDSIMTSYGYHPYMDDQIDIGNDGMRLSNDICSKSCCSPQFPTPGDMPEDPFILANKDKFVPTGYTCNNSFNDSGCLCMTRKQGEFINRRGNNA